MGQDQPTHVAGFTIQTQIEFGAFGRSYVGFHSQEGRRILKILRDGEDIASSDEEHAKLKEDSTVLHFEPRQQTQEGQRVLVAHFYQAASFGTLVNGSELQKGCEKTLRELDPNGDAAQTLRGTTLQQRLELLKQVAQRLEQLHAEKRSFPYITPWNIMLSDARPKLVDLGLGYQPEKLDSQQLHEDVLVYYAPEVLRAIAEKKAVQVSPAADVYALALSMRSILLERVAEPEAATAPAAPGGQAPAGLSKREALLAGKPWKKTPQERISRRLDSILIRAASHEPGRRPSASQLVKEIDAVLKDKAIAWSPPSQAPKLALIGVAALAIVGGVVFAILPSGAEATAKQAYETATAKPAAEALAGIDDALKVTPADTLKNHPELLRERACGLLAQPNGDPKLAIEALHAYVEKAKDQGDALAARLIAACMNRWTTFEHDKTKAELEAIAAAGAPDDASKQIPDLARCALTVWPSGVEGELRPEDVKKWADACTAARSEDCALNRAWVPAGYDKEAKKPAGRTFGAKWIPTFLLGRLKDLMPNDDGKTELDGTKAALGFATQGAYALHLARAAKDDKDVDAAKAALDAAIKLKKEGQAFAEGSLAAASLLLKAAASSKTPVADFKKAQEAFDHAGNEAAATPGFDVKGAATRGHLLAGAQAGIAAGMAVANGNAPEAPALREAETVLGEYLDAAQKDPKNTELNALVADAHVALGLAIQAQPNRDAKDWGEHVLFAYKDADLIGQHAYRLADSPANQVCSKILFDQAKKDFTANATSDKPDRDKDTQLHQRIDALCKLEKFDTSFMSLTDAQFHRNQANLLKGNKRWDELVAAKNAFEGCFGADGTWKEGLEGRTEALLVLAAEVDDTSKAGGYLADAQGFLDKAVDALKARKITGKEVQKAVDGRKQAVRQAWFSLLGKWLNAKGDQADFSNTDDQSFATKLFDVAEGNGAPEVDAAAKAQLAQLHYIYGKWNYDQKNYTAAATHLGLAVDGLPPEKDQLQSQAALLAADVALSKAESVRAEDSPWHGGVKEATNWGHDVLAKRLGAQSYRSFIDAVRSGKLALIKDEQAAKRLVDDILKNPDAVSDEDLALAAKIYSKSAKAQVLLARKKNAGGQKEEARASAKAALDLVDANSPEILVEAAAIWCVNTPQADMKTSDFKAVVDKAIAAREAAAAKLKGDPRFKLAFVGSYWLGRYNQAVADDRANAGNDPDAKKSYLDAQKAYNDYIQAVKGSGADRPPEAQDADERATKCGIAANS